MTNTTNNNNNSSMSPANPNSPSTRPANQPQPTHLETPSTVWGGGCKLPNFISHAIRASKVSFAPSIVFNNMNTNSIEKRWEVLQNCKNNSKIKLNDFAPCQNQSGVWEDQKTTDETTNIFLFVSATGGGVSTLSEISRNHFNVLSLFQKLLFQSLSPSHQKEISQQEREHETCSTSFVSHFRRDSANTSFIFGSVLNWMVQKGDFFLSSNKSFEERIKTDFPSLDLKEFVKGVLADKLWN